MNIKSTEPTTIRLSKEWKEEIKKFQEENDDGLSNSSGTLTAYIIIAIKERMLKDGIIEK